MENGMEITVSETTAAYAEVPRHPNINTKRESLEAAADKFWNSGAYFPAVVGTAALFLFSGHNIGGMAVIFAFLIPKPKDL